jgi:hypothetical protein
MAETYRRSEILHQRCFSSRFGLGASFTGKYFGFCRAVRPGLFSPREREINSD